MSNKIYDEAQLNQHNISDTFNRYVNNISNDIIANIKEISNSAANAYDYIVERGDLIFNGDPLGNDYMRERINSIVYGRLQDIVDNPGLHSIQERKQAVAYMKRNGITEQMIKAVSPYKDRINKLQRLLLESLMTHGITIDTNIINDIFSYGHEYTDLYTATIASIMNGYDNVRSHMFTPASPSLKNIFSEINELIPYIFTMSQEKMGYFLQMYNGLAIIYYISKHSNDKSGIKHIKHMKNSDSVKLEHKTNLINRRKAISGKKVTGYKSQLEDLILSISKSARRNAVSVSSGGYKKIKLCHIFYLLFILVIVYVILLIHNIYVHPLIFTTISFILLIVPEYSF